MLQPILQPATAADEPFLFRLFCTSRPELSGLPLSLCEMQFRAQRLSYSARFPHADHYVVWVEGSPGGHTIVDRSPRRIHIVDIALLPELRGRGIGTRLLRALQQEAADAACPLRLTVFTSNPARRLYERLGFLETESQPPYVTMVWLPSPGSNRARKLR